MQLKRDNQHPINDPLQNADALLWAMIENLPGGAAFVVDSDLRYRLAEGEALAAAGFKPEDWVGKTIFEALPPGLAATYEVQYRKALAGEPFEVEHAAHNRFYISRGTPLRSANGEVYAVLVVSYDITDRKQAEAALRDKEAKLAQELADTKQLQHISSQLIQSENINALYEQILDAAIAILLSDMGSMQMFYPEQNELRLLAWKGFDPASAVFWEWVRVDSSSTCGVVFNTGERVIVADVETCDFMAGTEDLDACRLSGIRAMQSTPLISRDGRVMGMISNHWREPHQPSERELRLLDVLARQAADLIDRRQAEADAAADLEDMQRLHELGARLVAEDDIQTLYQEIVATAIALTRADAGSIQILDEATQDLVLLATQGSTPEMIQHFHRVNAGSNTSCGRALVTGDRTFVDFDVPQSEDPDGSMRLHLEAGYLSAQSTPLITRSGKAIGMVSTHWRKHHRPSDRELRFLDLLARQAADLIE
ncbi:MULTISPECIES: GAF domain-containing protein [Fischerella]|uniref:GAF domain-containing protein n=1 Tax=Fischerella muscicola CCMEE 5323 TaxID=2019572 RepID=A0A2N6K1Q5_FISMU|nr:MULTISPECIES: GAF domain-containing protein [Fischerella]MBD2432944.1 GAF domain-containing protein [Fischerella sp. FACHB-380]PLZ88579.1 GAF domain-containing protein [Fischerella muscicola CCMEE 5323]